MIFPAKKNARYKKITVKVPFELYEFLKVQIGKYNHVTSLSRSVERSIILSMDADNLKAENADNE
jgi:hypothetical protein